MVGFKHFEKNDDSNFIYKRILKSFSQNIKINYKEIII